MGWTNQAKKDAVGRWIKFDEEHPSWTVTFLADPQIVEKISTLGDRKGEAYNSYEFPVQVEGEEKILSVTQKSLLRQLIEEEEEDPLPGRTLVIKCLDLKKKTQWKIKEVAAPDNITNWKGDKEVGQDKEKFMDGVKATKAKRKPKEKKEGENEADSKANEAESQPEA